MMRDAGGVSGRPGPPVCALENRQMAVGHALWGFSLAGYFLLNSTGKLNKELRPPTIGPSSLGFWGLAHIPFRSRGAALVGQEIELRVPATRPQLRVTRSGCRRLRSATLVSFPPSYRFGEVHTSIREHSYSVQGGRGSCAPREMGIVRAWCGEVW